MNSETLSPKWNTAAIIKLTFLTENKHGTFHNSVGCDVKLTGHETYFFPRCYWFLLAARELPIGKSYKLPEIKKRFRGLQTSYRPFRVPSQNTRFQAISPKWFYFPESRAGFVYFFNDFPGHFVIKFRTNWKFRNLSRVGIVRTIFASLNRTLDFFLSNYPNAICF